MKYARRRIASSDGSDRLAIALGLALDAVRDLLDFLIAFFGDNFFLERVAEAVRAGLPCPLGALEPEPVTLSAWTSLGFLGTE
jgi:hypothetical protein